MAESNKQYMGDGHDNIGQAAHKTAEAAKQVSKAIAGKAASAGANATSAAAGAAVAGAAQTGQAVAGVAAGTAAGGPIGAVLAAAWALRHTLLKILVCLCLLVLFFIVAIISLPAIIFNQVFHTDPATVDPNLSTDPYAIYEEMSTSISDCVTDGYDRALAEVERIIEDGGYDYDYSMEALVDYGKTSADYDVCYILAAYSASMNQQGTSESDMAVKLGAVSDQMFQVTSEEKVKERVKPVTYSTYEAKTVTVVTEIASTGSINGVTQYRYETETQTYYVETGSEVSTDPVTVTSYKVVEVDVPVYTDGKITGTEKKTYYTKDGTETLTPTTEMVKYVECTIHPFDQSVVLTAFNIDSNAQYDQFNTTYGEAIFQMANSLKMTLYGSTGDGSVPPLTDAELIAFLNRLDCSGTRKELIRVGLSLVGRVPYFWGGKSEAGWNPDWNTPKLVTSAGSSSTGTIRPYGLDCSGFTDWVYKTVFGKGLYAIGAEPGLYTVELNTISSELPEQIKKGQIQLVKHIDKWDEDIDPDEQISGGNTGMVEQPEAGAEFKIYLASAGSFENAKESERDILVTDENGFCISKSLPYGRYLVTQSAGMEGQAFVPDFTVFIREDMQTYSYILNNSTITGRIRIEKHDAETGEIIPVSGIGFKVRDMSTGEFIQQTVYYPNPVTYEVFYTGPDGVLWLPDELPYGSFELVEVETAYGYVLDSNPVPFEVTGETEVITVVKENYPQMGTIKITKSGEIFSSVTENEGVYQPVYEEASLEGATFDIIAESDIVTGDGTVRAHKGDVVDTITTTTQGAESKPLYLGSYRIVEKESPVGMVACEDQFATLTYAGQEISLTSTEVNIYNQRQKLQIELIKSMETDALFSIGQAEEYKAVSFGLYAQTDLVAADGTMIPADGLIEVVNLNPETMQTDEETGVLRFTAQFASDLPIGSYYLQERSSDSQFVISQEKFPVVFEYQGPDTELVTITANEGKPIVNELIRGKIQGLKVDENGNGLGGANIGLFKPETTEFTEENALMVTKSADNGSFAFEGVPAGHWVVREIAPPEAFVLNDELHHVYIGTDEETIEIQIENKKIRGGVQLIKVDAEYPEIKLSGAVFEVYEDTNANKTLDAEDMLMGTMEEVDTGLYEMRDLAYNGYFVVEKQGPAQFKTDSTPYYFEIRTDGEMVRVSNADNGYFENEAMRGALKIIKTSSDGKKEGFTFHVESEELGYSETFVTDQNGEILIEGLRIGKYMVYEEKNEQSEGYVLPDPVEVEIVSEEVLEVHVHNDKVTIDVPQTGDKSDLTLWFVLLGVGAAGCVSAVFLSRKKHKAASDNKTSSDQ